MINSAATIKRAMNMLLHGLDNVEFYWDDILVNTRTWEEHIRALRKLFRRLLAAGMTIRPTISLFGVNTVDFLGHRLEEQLLGLHERQREEDQKCSKTNNEEADKIVHGFSLILQRFYPQLRSFGCPAVRSHSLRPVLIPILIPMRIRKRKRILILKLLVNMSDIHNIIFL